MATSKSLLNTVGPESAYFVSFVNSNKIAELIVDQHLTVRRNKFNSSQMQLICVASMIRKLQSTSTNRLSRLLDETFASAGPQTHAVINMLGSHLIEGGRGVARGKDYRLQVLKGDSDVLETAILNGELAQAILSLRSFAQANSIALATLTFPTAISPSITHRYYDPSCSPEDTTQTFDYGSPLTDSLIIRNSKYPTQSDYTNRPQDELNEPEFTTIQQDRYHLIDLTNWVSNSRMRNSSNSDDINTLAQAQSFLFPVFLFSNSQNLDATDGADLHFGTITSVKLEDVIEHNLKVSKSLQLIELSTLVKAQQTEKTEQPVGSVKTNYATVSTPSLGVNPPKPQTLQKQPDPNDVTKRPDDLLFQINRKDSETQRPQRLAQSLNVSRRGRRKDRDVSTQAISKISPSDKRLITSNSKHNSVKT